MQSLCPICTSPIQESFLFCPHCGNKLKGSDDAIPLGKQILLYIIAFLLPPFGLVPGINYIRSSDPKKKRVGLIIVILTVVSIGIMLLLLQSIMVQYNALLENIQTGNSGL